MTLTRGRTFRRAAAAMRSRARRLVAGHSAHVFHGAEPGVLYDLGDFLDDYAVNSRLRNDLGLLFVTLDSSGPVRLGSSAQARLLPHAASRVTTRTGSGVASARPVPGSAPRSPRTAGSWHLSL